VPYFKNVQHPSGPRKGKIRKAGLTGNVRGGDSLLGKGAGRV